MRIRRPLRAEAAPSRSGQATELLRRVKIRVSDRPPSVITSKAPPDLINPFIERIKSGMKALVVKAKYITNHYQPKKPVVTL
jgi:hypothetical protein